MSDWKDLLRGTLSATDKNGTPKRNKKGEPYFSGFAYLNDGNGTAREVYITVYVNKAQVAISVSQPPPKNAMAQPS